MPIFGTNSWQAMEALVERTPYATNGAMRAVAGGVYSSGRLPSPWREQYRQSRDAGHITYTVMSYDTPIAWVLDSGAVVIPIESEGRNKNQPIKYSITTSGHQTIARAGLAADRSYRTEIHERAADERQQRRDRVTRSREAVTEHDSNMEIMRELGRIEVQEGPTPYNAAYSPLTSHPDTSREDYYTMRAQGYIEDSDGIWSRPRESWYIVPADVAPVRMEYSESYSERQGWASGNVCPYHGGNNTWWS